MLSAHLPTRNGRESFWIIPAENNGSSSEKNILCFLARSMRPAVSRGNRCLYFSFYSHDQRFLVHRFAHHFGHVPNSGRLFIQALEKMESAIFGHE